MNPRQILLIVSIVTALSSNHAFAKTDEMDATVAGMQRCLNMNGYDLSIDGLLGSTTKGAMYLYSKQAGIDDVKISKVYLDCLANVANGSLYKPYRDKTALSGILTNRTVFIDVGSNVKWGLYFDKKNANSDFGDLYGLKADLEKDRIIPKAYGKWSIDTIPDSSSITDVGAVCLYLNGQTKAKCYKATSDDSILVSTREYTWDGKTRINRRNILKGQSSHLGRMTSATDGDRRRQARS